jgi:hypothetical protein
MVLVSISYSRTLTTKSRWKLAAAAATIDAPEAYRLELALAPAREERWSVRRALLVILAAGVFGWLLIIATLYVLLP